MRSWKDPPDSRVVTLSELRDVLLHFTLEERDVLIAVAMAVGCFGSGVNAARAGEKISSGSALRNVRGSGRRESGYSTNTSFCREVSPLLFVPHVAADDLMDKLREAV